MNRRDKNIRLRGVVSCEYTFRQKVETYGITSPLSKAPLYPEMAICSEVDTDTNYYIRIGRKM
jgi:hypothetical protein